MLHKVTKGTIFPREDGKIIDEHFGVISTQRDDFSLAHMLAPANWSEAAQIAEFDEVMIVVRGQLAIEAESQRLIVEPGESCIVGRGTRVTYSNASSTAECEYWSLCLPAFRPERTNVNPELA